MWTSLYLCMVVRCVMALQGGSVKECWARFRVRSPGVREDGLSLCLLALPWLFFGDLLLRIWCVFGRTWVVVISLLRRRADY
jgi:hypothetical protein